jgi:CRISPR-associated protein Cas2
MPMTVIVTRDVAPRFGGFLTSCMVEIGPGVFTSPTMSRGVRERMWAVLQGWFGELGGGSIVMTWRDPLAAGRQGLSVLGLPPRTLVEVDGILLVKEDYNKPDPPLWQVGL